MPRILLLAVTASLTACTAAESIAPSVCTGKCDDGTTEAPALRCWIEGDPQNADAFTARDALLCQAQADTGYAVAAVNVFTADNKVEGVLFDASNAGTPVTVMRFYRQAAYPLRVKVDMHSTLGSDNVTLPPSLATEFNIAGTSATPVALTLPFRVGAVTLDAHFERGAVAFDYELDLAPFTTHTGDTKLRIQRSLDMRAGDRRTIQLPKVPGPIAAKVAGVARELPGFGHFAISDTNVTPVAAATGAVVATCTTSAGSSTDAVRSVSCKPAVAPLVDFSNTVVKIGDAPAVALMAEQEVVVGEFAVTAFPLPVVITAAPTAKSGAVFDPALVRKNIDLPLTLASEVGTTATARLAIDFWAADVRCTVEYCLFDREAAMLPVASRFQWGFNVLDNNIISLSQDEQRSYVFASEVGQSGFAGTAVVIDGDRDIESQATLAAGNYLMDGTGLHIAP